MYCQHMIRSQSAVDGELVLLEGRKEGGTTGSRSTSWGQCQGL